MRLDLYRLRRGELMGKTGRQGIGKSRADALAGQHLEVAAVAFDDPAGDGEAQPRALFVLSSGKVGFVETVPDLFQGILGDPHAGVLDGDEDFAVLLRCLNCDGGIVVAEFDCIINEIVQHLLDFSHIGADV